MAFHWESIHKYVLSKIHLVFITRVLAACEYYTRSSLIYFISQTKDRSHEATNLFQPIYQYLMVMGVSYSKQTFCNWTDIISQSPH